MLNKLSSIKSKSNQQIGRGGKRGTTSGRGQKGQKSRSGRKMRPASRDLILRIAKKRGFRNKPITEKPFIIDIASLVSKVKAFSQGNKPVVVDKETLKQIDLLPKGYAGVVKILGKGEISFPVRIEGMKVSEGIKAAVEKAGGSIA